MPAIKITPFLRLSAYYVVRVPTSPEMQEERLFYWFSVRPDTMTTLKYILRDKVRECLK